jgi:hypothetical protein
MKPILLLYVATAVLVWASQTESSNIVDPKVILELQPQSHELGDMFYDPTVDQMLNRGYTHLENLLGNAIGQVEMQTLGAWLEASGYGVLLYGAHGGTSGETGGETFTTFNDADSKRAWLITWQYFTADQLGPILQNPAHTFWFLTFSTTYTNGEPAGCDVALIASCDGASSGDFNASCKLGPSACITNTALATSFNCLMSHLTQAADRTFDLAAAKCAQEMTNPPFAYAVSNGDWQLFSFDNPAADVHGVLFEDGVVTFKVGSEPDIGPGATDHYEIEASPQPNGPWATVESTIRAGAGHRSVRVGDVGPFIRLVEVEHDGDRLIHGLARADATVGKTAARSMTEAAGSQHGTLSGETVVAYAIPELVDVVESEIASFWSTLGASVLVVSTAGFPTDPASFRTAVKADIASRVGGGADAILFVGDANDHVQFTGAEYPLLWLPANGWEAIRQNYLGGGYADQSSRDRIPTFYITDTDPRGVNMGYVTPYWMTDWPFVDVDSDGLPDVPIARLPFTTTDEVYAYASKLWTSQAGDYGATTIGMFAGDVNHGANDGSEVVAALNAIATATPGVQHEWLYESAYPSILQRNEAAADLWNTAHPELVFILGTWSNRSWPAGFFDQTVTPPFTMDALASHVGVVVALTCGTGNFAQTEDSDYGRPIAERFLAEWYKGAVAWVGPSVGTWQHANSPLAVEFAERLFEDSSRPVAFSFLLALRAILTEYADQPDIVRTSLSTGVLGDPLVRVHEADVVTAVGDAKQGSTFALGQNAPNPFNPATMISFDLPTRGRVSLQVFDVQGRFVATLADRVFSAGRHQVNWDGTDEHGQRVASGVYFYRLSTTGQVESRKMVVLK